MSDYRLSLAIDGLADNFADITVANGYKTAMVAAKIHKALRTLDQFDPEDTPAIMLGFQDVQESTVGGQGQDGRLIQLDGTLVAYGVTYDQSDPSQKAINLAWDIGRNIRENPHIGNHPTAGQGFIAHSCDVRRVQSLAGQFHPGIEGVIHPYDMTRVEVDVVIRYPHLLP